MWGTYSTIQRRLSEASLKNPDETTSVFKQTYTQQTRVWADKFRDFSVAQESLRQAKLRDIDTKTFYQTELLFVSDGGIGCAHKRLDPAAPTD